MLSVIPTPPVAKEVTHLDKVVHFCEYLGFAWVLLRARQSSASRVEEPAHELFDVWLFASGYGLFLELVQGLLPWRSADWADAAVNAVGAAAGLWVGRR